MLKYLFLLFIAFSSSVFAYKKYPGGVDRFTQYDIPDTSSFLLKDNKTGCEYVTRTMSESSWTLLEGTCKSKLNQDDEVTIEQLKKERAVLVERLDQINNAVRESEK